MNLLLFLFQPPPVELYGGEYFPRVNSLVGWQRDMSPGGPVTDEKERARETFAPPVWQEQRGREKSVSKKEGEREVVPSST